MNCQTTGTGITYTTNCTGLWRCDGCMNKAIVKCGECGSEKLHCNRLNIDVEKDFYCKYWLGMYSGTYTNGPYQYTYTVDYNQGNMINKQ